MDGVPVRRTVRPSWSPEELAAICGMFQSGLDVLTTELGDSEQNA
jgi:hypothetical protein